MSAATRNPFQPAPLPPPSLRPWWCALALWSLAMLGLAAIGGLPF